MTAGDLVRLVRLPLVITALFDPVAGLYLAGGGAPLRFLGVATASACLYLGGMALNDLFDVAFDRVHHPGRVLPSGRIRPGQALAAGATLLMAGVASAGLVSARCAAVALGLAVLVLFYDGFVKRVALLGPAVMGTCRGLSLLLGACGAAHASPPPGSAWIAAAALAVWVTGVTAVSRLEEAGGGVPRARVRRRLVPGLAGLAAIPGLAAAHPLPSAAPLLLLGLLTFAVDFRAPRRLDRSQVMRHVGTGVRGVLLVDASILWGAGAFALGTAALGTGLLATLIAGRGGPGQPESAR